MLDILLSRRTKTTAVDRRTLMALQRANGDLTGFYFHRIFPNRKGKWHQIAEIQHTHRFCGCGYRMDITSIRSRKYIYEIRSDAPPIEERCWTGRRA